MALTRQEKLTWVVEEFCDDHNSSKAEDNANYELDVSTFNNWCDATGNDEFKDEVQTNAKLRELIANSAFAELAGEVPA